MNQEKIFFVKDQEREFLSKSCDRKFPVWNMLNITSSSTRDFFKNMLKDLNIIPVLLLLYFGVEMF